MKIKRTGFTLIELLLGLAITAIIGVTIYNMFWSGVKLDDRMRRVFDNSIELLLANQAMTHDLENAISLDLSNSYPDAVIFDGQKKEFSFITQTNKGLRRIRYFIGDSQGQSASTSTIGRVVNSSNPSTNVSFDYLWRQESSLADWLNQTTNDTNTQILISGLKAGSFGCQYAPMQKDLHNSGAQGVSYEDSWNDKGLPMAVSCSFILTDPKNAKQALAFKRDVFLAPVAGFYHEQQ